MFTQKNGLLFLLLILLAFPLMIPAAAGADYATAYNDFGMNNSYGFTGPEFGSFSPNQYQVAAMFTSSSSGALYGLALAAQYLSGNNVITLSLLSDNGATLGSTLWSETFTNQLGPMKPTGNGQVLDVNNLGGPVLSAGSTYWLLVSTDSTSQVVWWEDSTNMTSNYAQIRNGVPSYFYSTNNLAMSVTVDTTAAPITGPVWLFGSGLAGLIGLKRKYSG